MTPERALLRDMLEMYTPTGEEHHVAELLVHRFRNAGLEARCDEVGNFVGHVGNGPIEVMLLGHIDTVPGKIPVVERDGRLWGRGAVDAKGPMATFVSAALRLACIEALHNLRLLVIGAVGEECGSAGAKHIVRRYRPRHLIIGEPSGWDSLVLGYKGSLRVRYELQRSTRHSAGPDEAAPEVALHFWQQIKTMASQLNDGKRIFDQLSPSLRTISTHSDGLTDFVEMDIDIHLPLGYSSEPLESQLRGWVGEAKLEVAFDRPAVKGDKNTPVVRSFLSALREVGAHPRFKVKTGTSDMNIVGPAWRCPMLAYGPGNSILDHTPEEHIELAEYDRAITVLETALRNLDKAEAI